MIHRRLGLGAGLSPNEIEKLGDPNWSDWSTFAPRDQRVIAFTTAWTLRGEMSEEEMSLLAKEIGPEALVTLAMTVHQANWTNRFAEWFVCPEKAKSANPDQTT